jgi:hypothetical protein
MPPKAVKTVNISESSEPKNEDSLSQNEGYDDSETLNINPTPTQRKKPLFSYGSLYTSYDSRTRKQSRSSPSGSGSKGLTSSQDKDNDDDANSTQNKGKGPQKNDEEKPPKSKKTDKKDKKRRKHHSSSYYDSSSSSSSSSSSESEPGDSDDNESQYDPFDDNNATTNNERDLIQMMRGLQTVFRTVGFSGQREAKFVDLPTFKGGDQDLVIG